MGGMIAQELAIRFPERVRGLVLGGTTPGGPRAARPTLRELGALGAGAAGGWTRRRAARGWASGCSREAFRREQPERVRELLRHFGRHRAPPQGVWAHWWASVYHDTIVAAGLHPGADARHARRAATRWRRSPTRGCWPSGSRTPSCAIVPGAGHAYLLERPEASFELLGDWLDRALADRRRRAARAALAARAEPLTRALGLPIGAARTGASLAGLTPTELRRRGAPCGA